MIKFFNYKKILSITAIKEGGRNPYVDWVMILLISTTVLIILILGGVTLYEKVRNGEFEASNKASTTTKKVFNQKDLKYIIERYNTRAENINLIKSGFETVPDPSK